jgi:PAS domain S-box-containing protein
VLAAAIFALELIVGYGLSVATLYVIVLLIPAASQGRRSIYTWTGLCIGLACIAFVTVDGLQPDWHRLLQLVFGLASIGITGALLVSRSNLELTRAALANSREDLKNFADSVPQLLWRTRPDGFVDYFNRRYTDLTGHDLDEAMREQNWLEYFHPDDAEPFMEAWNHARATSDEIRHYFRMLHADQSYRWMYLVGRAVRSPDTGEVVRWYGGTTDAHEQVLAQNQVNRLNETLEQRVAERTAELAEAGKRFNVLWNETRLAFAEHDISKAKVILDRLHQEGVTDFRGYVATHPDVLAVCTDGVELVGVNGALAKLMGFEDPTELVSSPAKEYVERRSDIVTGLLGALFQGEDTYQGEAVLIKQDGTRVPVAFHVSMASETRAISSLLDISERERLQELRLATQEELARANRAATMGAFSASLTHELSQPIAAISMDAKSAQRWLEQEPANIKEALETIERVARNTERVASIIRWSRQQLVRNRRSPALLNVNTLVHETKSLLERELRARRATLVVPCADEVANVKADRTELQQVLINLILNAVDAMKDLPEDSRIVTVAVSRGESSMLQVTVSDRGHGIPVADLNRLFDPFFTTKPGGMGMGLQIVRNIMDATGGAISAGNSPQGGAVFTLTIPLAEEGSPANSDVPAGVGMSQGGLASEA